MADNTSFIRSLIANEVGILGAFSPLPALFEEVVRAWQGLPTETSRLSRMESLIDNLRLYPSWRFSLAKIAADNVMTNDVRILAAILLAHTRCPDMLPVPFWRDEIPETIFALANFTHPEKSEWYFDTLIRLMSSKDTDLLPAWGQPGSHAAGDSAPVRRMLLLICFLRGLFDETLGEELFSRCVLQANVLSPGISAHRPLRKINRLLDYLGLSENVYVMQLYRQLAAEIWPRATLNNWRQWHWVTVPGGPEIFHQALQAICSGDRSALRLHELKYAIFPLNAEQTIILKNVDPAIRLLLCWLRPEMVKWSVDFPGGKEALRWMRLSNKRAAEQAYRQPSWWMDMVGQGLPVARQALCLLKEIQFSGKEGPYWKIQDFIPSFWLISANLLLAQAAGGENEEELISLAEMGDVSAIRAMALLPKANERVLKLLIKLRRDGGKPEKAAACLAQNYIAERQGLPGADELERQHFLTAAWDLGPLAGERVRVGWQEGMYRLRLSLNSGRVQLGVLGPRGPLTRLPADLTRSSAYKEARSAQKEAQAQYRLFKESLEKDMVEERPISVGEFRYLNANPIFAHLAERLVWQQAGGESFLWAGPDRWESLDGCLVDVSSFISLTLAHPVALTGSNMLVNWQSVAVDRRLLQPFKQIFREVYLPSPNDEINCERFAGRQIDPGRAYALLRASGFAPGSGIARREWPGKVTTHLCWAEGAEGHDLFGGGQLPHVTTGKIWFSRDGKELPISQVDRIVFSETLRAADLLTTRAAVGDAELTSRETIALRALLLRESARSFNLTNIIVREEGAYALVLGKLATYRVNLASGTVMLEPEGRQVVLPRHEERWKLVEEGDATGEVISIVLALAHDHEIGDLTFLAQVSPG